MPLTPGTRFGTHEIVNSLGSGGMGEVYRARDTRLNRYVAVKILLSTSAGDTATLARFEREAETLAALNHPGIAQIYGVAETDAGLALLMELVDGLTLAEVVRAGPLPTATVVDIAVQLTAALSYAHHAGVIHRDLKPANIKIRSDAAVKILDFGLAKKLTDHGPTATTVQAAPTIDGIVGTPGYMAPELLRGGPADVRSDIFALGVVLFELLTGRNPFQRGSVFETAQAILDPAAPTWPAQAVDQCPAWLGHLVSKSMAKNRAERYQSIDEMVRDLAASRSDLAPGFVEPSKTAPRSPRNRRAWLTAAIVAAIASVAAVPAWRFLFDTQEVVTTDTPVDVADMQVTFVGNLRAIALSPDGRTAAYAAGTDGRVMVRDVAGGQALEVWRGDLVVEIQWMRDGSSIVISGIQEAGLGIWLVPRFGGAARRLPIRGAHIAPSPDNQWIATAMQNTQGFQITSISTGSSRTIGMTGFRWLLSLDWSPTSNRLAVLTEADDGSRTIWTIAPDGSDKRRLYTATSLASIRWSPLEAAIYAIRPRAELADVIRVEDIEAVTEPRTLLRGLPWDGSDPYRENSSLSTNGRKLLVIRSHTYANLWKLAGDGSAPTQRTHGTSRFGRPRISPDGRWIATALGSGRRSAIVKLSSEGGDPIPLTSEEGFASSPVWSPDGSQIAYVAMRADNATVWIVAADGSSTLELVNSAVEHDPSVLEWLRGGQLLRMTPGGTNYVIRDLRSGVEEPFVRLSGAEHNGWLHDLRASPAGDMFAFWWNTPKDAESDGLTVAQWPTRITKTLDYGDFYPAGWLRDGKSLFAYEFLGRSVIQVTIPGGTKKTVGQFATGAIDGCDTTPNGALVCAIRVTQSDAWMVENFDSGSLTVKH